MMQQTDWWPMSHIPPLNLLNFHRFRLVGEIFDWEVRIPARQHDRTVRDDVRVLLNMRSHG